MSRAIMAEDSARLATHAEFAPAKVNLTLRVLGRRDDGRHILDSLTVFANIGDMVRLTENAGEVEVSGLFAPHLRAEQAAGAAMSVERAQRALIAHAGADAPDIWSASGFHIEKHLPIAAGLGGGTADAGAALRLLNRIAGPGYDAATLAGLGAALGADVPACVHSRPLMMRDAGEQVTALPRWPDLAAVLINPRQPAPTGAVFNAFKDSDTPFAPGPETPPDTDDPAAALAFLAASANDLTPAAMAVQPAMTAVLHAAQTLPGAKLARMTGSGATVCALFDTRAEAEAAAAALTTSRPDWWVRAGVLQGVRP